MRPKIPAEAPDNVNALVKAFLEKSGFEILSIRSSGVDYVDLSLTPLQASWELGKRLFEEARRADALYFPGAPQLCVDIIEPLEKELGTFVISSLQASLWKAMQILKHQVPVEGTAGFFETSASPNCADLEPTQNAEVSAGTTFA
jgi:maleate cis-trans isomerase